MQGPPIGYWNEAPAYGYYAEPPQEFVPYGYYAEPPGYGYYAEPLPGYGYYSDYAEPAMGYYGDYGNMVQPVVPEAGYYGDPQDYAGYGYGYGAPPPSPYGYGYYGEPAYGYYAEPPGYADYEPYEPVGYYADEQQPYEGYGGNYGDATTQMAGYSQYAPTSEAYPPESYGYYGEPDYSGYVRETAMPPFNAGCPLPVNVAGFAEAEQEPFDEVTDLTGYQQPTTVSPVCGMFTPQPGLTEQVPETFRPLW